MAVTPFMPHVIERVSNADGKVLYARNPQPLGRIVEARYAGMMNTMMEQTLSIGTAHKASLPGWPAAGKTGTSQDFRDAWFIGYTSHLVTGVWLGNDDNTPTKHVTGGSMPVDIWSRFMRDAHQGVPVTDLPTRRAKRRRPVLRIVRRQRPSTDAASADPATGGNCARRNATTGTASLDGWMLNNLFGRRRD